MDNKKLQLFLWLVKAVYKQIAPAFAEAIFVLSLFFVRGFFRALLSADQREADDEEEEEDGEGHPAEEAGVVADFRLEHVIVPLEVDRDDDERQQVAEVEFCKGVHRDLQTLAGIDFGQEVFEAPAVLRGTEEDEGQRAQRQHVVGDDEVFKIEDRGALAEHLEFGPDVVTEDAGKA